MSFPSLARADGTSCVVRLHEPLVAKEERAAWRRAVRDLERSTQAEPGDCSSVDVRVDAGGASVDLRTVDGREAERHVQTPGELGPQIRALLTGYPEIPAPAPAAAPYEEASAGPPAALDPQTPEPDVAKALPPPTHPEVFGALGAGLKLQDNDGASAIGEALVGISIAAWQVGAFARWEFEHHQDTDTAIHHSNLDAGGGGAMFGRRQTLGPVTLVYGTSFGLYSVEQERGSHHNTLPRAEGSLLDPRAGLYLGCIMKASGPIRTRAQLSGEVAFVDHATAAALPEVPQWGLGLTVGVDFGFLP